MTERVKVLLYIKKYEIENNIEKENIIVNKNERNKLRKNKHYQLKKIENKLNGRSKIN